MAVVKPFRGLRPLPELAEKVASPPYDVLSSEEARELAKGNPYSFLYVIKPEIDLPEGIDLYDDRVYAKGKEHLDRLCREGVLRQDDKPCFYIYKQKMGDHLQIGLVACASVDDYERDVIKKHEHTREEKEIDRARHIYTLNANTGPVFLTYPAVEDIDKLIQRAMEREPVYDFESDGVRHTFYVVDDPFLTDALESAFRNVPVLYVADGHHRSAAATRVRKMKAEENPDHTGDEEYNYFLVVIFPHNQMKIMDYNRVVKDLNGLGVEEFFRKIEEKFSVEEWGGQYKPDTPHTFGMYIGGKWYRLTAKQGTFDEDDPVLSLDVSILQENLLAPVLGISDPRKDKRINFVGGIRGLGDLERLVDSGEYKVAFAVYPTTINQLMAIADAGKVMPPKSTWFEPKLKSGLVIHTFD